MSGSFADSNILLYLPDRDLAKADMAATLLAGDLSISVQVLNEVASVMLGKWRRSWLDVDGFLSQLRQATIVHPLTQHTHAIGLAVAKTYRFSVYDSMIVAAALLADCDTLYTEDMHHGLLVENRLRIVNPFAAA